MAEGPTTEALDRQAEAILRDNDRGGYTVPTHGLYPFQWNWDSCLVALGWARLDEARAWAEIETLFSAQWDDGMVPHIVFHRADPGYFPGPGEWGTGHEPPTSGITQPPVAASVVLRLLQGAREGAAARAAAGRLLPKLDAWHRWFASARDPEGTGLAAILHPWESGRDNNPDWDAALVRVAVEDLPPYQRRDTAHVEADQRPRMFEYDRYMSLVHLFRRHRWDPGVLHGISPFKMVDIGLNAILLRAERDLARLAAILGEDALADAAAARVARIEPAWDSLWDEEAGVFRSLDRTTGRLTDAATSAAFLAFWAGAARGDRGLRLAATLDRWLARVRFGVPSLDPFDARFDRLRYWRGPVWAVVNFMTAEGLRQAGHEGQAARIAADTAQLMRGAGFHEYFDPVDGRGLGGGRFTWTAAMWLAWARTGSGASDGA